MTLWNSSKDVISEMVILVCDAWKLRKAGVRFVVVGLKGLRSVKCEVDDSSGVVDMNLVDVLESVEAMRDVDALLKAWVDATLNLYFG